METRAADPSAFFEADTATHSLATRLSYLPVEQAAESLHSEPTERAAGALALLTPATAVEILWELDTDQRARLAAAAPGGRGEQWLLDHQYEEGTVGRLMAREYKRLTTRPAAPGSSGWLLWRPRPRAGGG